MASIVRHKSGWRAQVAIKGVRRSKVFERKQDAKDWAAREEYLIRKGEGKYGPGTLGDIFDRYARTVSPTKRGERWEQVRLRLLSRDKLARIDAKDVTAADFADWRDRRLQQVLPSTVRREMNLLGAIMSVAVDEWGIFPASPMKGVKKPPDSRHRDRLVTDEEIERLREAVHTKMEAEAIRAFECSCASGMRAGELRKATRKGRVAYIQMTKNGDPREVPLSSKAAELFGDGFTLSARQLDTAFRRVRDRAGIEDLTFHDARATAVSNMAKKLNPLELARVVGHKDIKMLMVYYRTSAQDIAQILDD